MYARLSPPALRWFGCLLVLLAGLPVQAQDRSLPMQVQPLDDLSGFRPVADNWRIAGSASSDYRQRHHLAVEPGRGVLVNVTDGTNDENLFTTWEHGDLELELEYMMPRGSNSGIYLQGRYEVQLLDSWGVETPRYSDSGGIYERWDDARPAGQKGYEGHPPRMNVSRAPGLWQTMRIVFQAPRFDARGRKVANARFVQVVHNGVVVQENVEVTGPTRAAAFEDERPTGPLMLQGDHGPVAFRNIRYKQYGAEVRLSDLRYRYYENDDLDRLLAPGAPVPAAGLAPAREGRLEGLTWDLVSNPDQFALRYDGTLTVPASGTYLFALDLNWISDDPHFQDMRIGGGRLVIGDRTALEHRGRAQREQGLVELEAGTYPFTLSYYKSLDWGSPSAVLYTEGPGVPFGPLNVPESLPQPSSVAPILVEAEGEPVVLRSFVEHGGEKMTHAVSVGEPSGMHYSMDLGRGALLQVWRGDFLDATPMWHSRGTSQLTSPVGSVVELAGRPALAVLPSREAPWPDSIAAGYRLLGYDLGADRRPVFRYRVGTAEVADRLYPEPQREGLVREVTVRGARASEGLWLHVAGGDRITRGAGGTYVVDDAYYVELTETGEAQPLVRTVNGRQELLLPVRPSGGEATLRYRLIW